jgi:hypothetical protein
MRYFSCLCNDYEKIEEVHCYVDKIINCNHIQISSNENNIINNYNIKLNKIAPIPGKEAVAINALKNFILNTKVTIRNIDNINVEIFRGPISVNDWLIYNNYAYILL